MPEKHSESRIMAMLERRGIVRKVDKDYDTAEATPDSDEPRASADLRSMFGHPTSNASSTAASTRQPIPGMSSPTIPDDRQRSYDRDEPRPPSRLEPNERAGVNQYPSGIDTLNSSSQWDEEPSAPHADARPGEWIRQPADRYTDQYLEIDELYEALALKSKRTETIYLVEEYLKTLPDSLPEESRRDIVGKIIRASGFDYDLLMGDGVVRVKMLKEYAERFAQQTEDYVAAREAELDELEQQILRTRKLIENRRELHKKQFFTIETEAQRLTDILTFISG